MEQFKGTKGEWVISKRNIELKTLEDGSGVFEAVYIQCDNKNIVLVPTDWSESEAKANAKLIAAAPEMLEALISAVGEIRECGLICMSDYFEKIIKKATE